MSNEPRNQGINPFNYDIQTTYVPHADDVVPAVPIDGQVPPAAIAAVPVPAYAAPAPSVLVVPSASTILAPAPQLQFHESVAPFKVTGNIGQPDSRSGPAGPSGRPDDGNFGKSDTSSKPLLPPDQRSSEDASKFAFYNLKRYRPYFDVDTKEVLWRVGNSIATPFRANFISTTMENPDLYGPFWVATTLIFVTAVAGNYSSYIAWKHDNQPSTDTTNSTSSATSNQWYNDTTKMSASAGLFYGYVFILGLLLWLAIKYLRGDMKLVNIYCMYGYSLTVFIPVSLACVAPIEWLRWLLVMLATASSALFLVMNVRSTLAEAPSSKSIPLIGLVTLLHVALGLGLKLYFFQYY